MSNAPPVVAIFNTSPDTIEMLRIVLEREGFVAMGAYTYELRDGEVDVEALAFYMRDLGTAWPTQWQPEHAADKAARGASQRRRPALSWHCPRGESCAS